MKKGISIWSFAEAPLKEKFLLAKRYGFEGVEVELTENGEISLDSTQADLDRIAALAEECGIELYSVATGLYWKYCLTSDSAEQREKALFILKKQIDTAARLNCDSILVIPGAVSVSFAPELGVMDYQRSYDRALENLKEIAPYAEQRGVCVCLENVWTKFLLSPLEMRDFIDKIGSPCVGAYFDVGNVLYSGYPEQWIRILNRRIRKVHFKDYRTAVGTLDGFVSLLSGDVDYGEVMRAFAEVGYDGWVTAEMLPPSRTFPESTLEDASNSMDRILNRK